MPGDAGRKAALPRWRAGLRRFWRRHWREIERGVLALLLLTVAGLAWMSLARLMPEHERLLGEIKAGNREIADLDTLKLRLQRLRQAFDERDWREAEQRLFDDAGDVAVFVQGLKASLEKAGFSVQTRLSRMSPPVIAGKPDGRLHRIALDVRLINPRVRKNSFRKLAEVLRRLPELGRKVEMISLAATGTTADFGRVSMRLALWSRFELGRGGGRR